MTVRENLRKSLDPINMGEFEMMPLTLIEFVQSMAALLIMDADIRLAEDVPDVVIDGIDGNEISGRAVKNPTPHDCICVLTGGDFVRHQTQHLQFYGFLDWLMDQDVTDCCPEEDIIWPSAVYLAVKMNEYVEMKKKGEI